MFLEETSETLAAYFLFAFDDKCQIARQGGPGLQISLDGFQMSQVLAFVVNRATSEHAPAADARFERR